MMDETLLMYYAHCLHRHCLLIHCRHCIFNKYKDSEGFYCLFDRRRPIDWDVDVICKEATKNE